VDGFQNSETVNIWIIGYGNRNRRDDGVGPHVADRLKLRFGDAGRVRMVSVHQLEPEIAEALRTSSVIIFIDSSREMLPRGGRAWSRIRPVLDMHGITHSLKAGTLLGLILLLYDRCPDAWMVSVQGSDYDFGEGLSKSTERSAIRVTGEVARFIQRGLKSNSPTKAINDNDRMENNNEGFYIRSKPWPA